MRLHVYIRFGHWSCILREPFPTDAKLYPFSTALLHYARTVALARAQVPIVASCACRRASAQLPPDHG